MIILAIETSCDDTGIAIVDVNNGTINILSNIVNTQTVHSNYGGVFPMVAKQEHIKNIDSVYNEAYKNAGEPKIDAIAVTVGPGLEPSLWVGIKFAEELSQKLNVPIIPVNHMEGHLLSSLLPVYEFNKDIKFREMPEKAISLLVSGGHTQLVQIENTKSKVDNLTNQNTYKILGTTLDDAVGEAYDKVARMLDLPYPGGPAISKLAQKARTSPQIDSTTYSLKPVTLPKFPRPMLHNKDYNFSYSGLKTAVLYYIQKLEKEHSGILQNVGIKESIAREFEDAAIEVIIKKTLRAIEETNSTHLLLGGGVSANKHLQNELERVSKENNFTVYYPVKEITGDNALMIAIAGYFNKDKKTFENQKANGSLKI